MSICCLVPDAIMSSHVTCSTEEDYGEIITGEKPEADDEEAVDKYLNIELMLDIGLANERQGRVSKRSRGIDGEAVGNAHANPLFDTR